MEEKMKEAESILWMVFHGLIPVGSLNLGLLMIELGLIPKVCCAEPPAWLPATIHFINLVAIMAASYLIMRLLFRARNSLLGKEQQPAT